MLYGHLRLLLFFPSFPLIVSCKLTPFLPDGVGALLAIPSPDFLVFDNGETVAVELLKQSHLSLLLLPVSLL